MIVKVRSIIMHVYDQPVYSFEDCEVIGKRTVCNQDMYFVKKLKPDILHTYYNASIQDCIVVSGHDDVIPLLTREQVHNMLFPTV